MKVVSERIEDRGEKTEGRRQKAKGKERGGARRQNAIGNLQSAIGKGGRRCSFLVQACSIDRLVCRALVCVVDR